MNKLFFSFFSFIIVLILSSCETGEDSLFNGSDLSESISIDAYITHSLDTASHRLKTDTLHPNDSVIFLVSVYPSKAIHMQNYFWKINGIKRGTEFSFRSAFQNPGKQTAIFHLVDYYGDTITDTLTIWISNPPQLNDSLFIPAKGTQQISTENGISFVWQANDLDTNDPLHHHFHLFNSETSFVDTIVYEPYFNYPYPLPPLHQFFWSVETFDSFNMKASQKIESSFFTKSYSPDKGAVVIPVSSQNSILYPKLKYQITPKSGQTLPPLVLEQKDNYFAKGNALLNDLEKGDYEIQLFHSEYPDFNMSPVSFSIRNNEVTLLDSLTLKDTIPPIVKDLKSDLDSLTIADTLSFIISDGGVPLTKNNIQVYFDSQQFVSWSYSDSLISVVISEEKQNDFFHLLSFKILDNSSNVTKQTFYLSPKAKTE